MSTPFPQCDLCNRLRSGEPNPTCDAFPEGIPVDLWNFSVSHQKPYVGDRGKQFEPLEEILKETIAV